jgi:hypothetical protein
LPHGRQVTFSPEVRRKYFHLVAHHRIVPVARWGGGAPLLG